MSRNYYKMSLIEINEYIEKMRSWIVRYAGERSCVEVLFALEVAINAREIKKSDIDDFTSLVIDIVS